MKKLVGPSGAKSRFSGRMTSGKFQLPGGARGALSFTYDDGLPCHPSRVREQLESAGLRGTFYVPILSDLLRDPVGWRRLASAGHELGNHTIFHPCRTDEPGRDWVKATYDLGHYSRDRWFDEVRVASSHLRLFDGQRARTFANTCCDETLGTGRQRTSLRPLIQRLFPAARTRTILGPNLFETLDLYQMGHVEADNRPVEFLIGLVDQVVEEGGWLVFMIHGVGAGTHESFLDPEVHARLIDHAASRRPELWVGPVIDLVRHLLAST